MVKFKKKVKNNFQIRSRTFFIMVKKQSKTHLNNKVSNPIEFGIKRVFRI